MHACMPYYKLIVSGSFSLAIATDETPWPRTTANVDQAGLEESVAVNTSPYHHISLFSIAFMITKCMLH